MLSDTIIFINGGEVKMKDVYEVCPQFEDAQYLLRFLSENDDHDLLKVYSDKKAVPLFNSDNCFGDFYFTSLETMQNVIKAWQEEYQKKRFCTLVNYRQMQRTGYRDH